MLDGCVRLAVTDTGSGVPADLAGQLFVPFQRLGAEFSAVEGTGIGLALSKRLVEAMDGRIGYRPEPGGGSTFWNDLPSAEAPAEWSPAAAAPAPAASPATRGASSVPQVEDNPPNPRPLEYLLATPPPVASQPHPSGQPAHDTAP